MEQDIQLQPTVWKTYPVTLDQSKYDILIGQDIVTSLGPYLAQHTEDMRVLIVVDSFFRESTVKPLVKALERHGFQTIIHYFTAGKTNKTMDEALKIFKILEENDYARDSSMIAIGGGVIGDLAGFVASTYFRGMNLVHVPTTLTAMIDSSIGGKVGLNFGKTINAIGGYYHPMVNIVDLRYLESLPAIDFQSGMAEIIKCAIIHDADLFNFLEANVEKIKAYDAEALMHIISRTIEIKLYHVDGDVRERSKRLKLNYGHTMGHSIESATGVFAETYRHGQGVALGMVGAAHIARTYFGCDDTILTRHEDILKKYDLPVYIDTKAIHFEPQQLLQDCLRNIRKDKKRKSNRLRFILPVEIGQSAIYNDVKEEMIEQAFRYLIR